jgi:hypothetical protein
MTAPGGLGPQTSLAPPYFIEVNVPGQEVYMGVRDISIFTIFLIEFGTLMPIKNIINVNIKLTTNELQNGTF